MRYKPTDELHSHLREQGIKRRKFRIDESELADVEAEFADAHPNETPEEIHDRAAYYLIWQKHKPKEPINDLAAIRKLILAFGAIIALLFVALLWRVYA